VGSKFHAYGPTDRWADRQTDMTKLIVTFRDFANALKTNHFMLYGEIIAVCSEIHKKLVNTLCGQNVELFNVKAGGA
jgi:hypothetical protein